MLSLRVALRYLFSRKSHGAVNIISAVSVGGVAVAAAAMVIVMSVFNGFSGLAESKLSRIDPDLSVVPAEGKVFAGADSLAALLRRIEGVASAEPVLTEQAFAAVEEKQMPVTLRGMTPAGLAASGLGEAVIDGAFSPGADAALLSVGTALGLNVRPAMGIPVAVFEPRRLGRVNPSNPATAFRADSLSVGGVFQIEQEEYDRDLLVVPLAMVRRLLDYDTEASSLSLTLDSAADFKAVRAEVEKALPPGLEALDRRQQQADAFRMIEVEKWITFVMLAFILAVASFNIVSTLSMLVIEKQQNIGVIRAMGGSRRFVSSIFANQGWLVTVAGGVFGIILGSALVLCQQHFGWVKLQAADPAMLSVDSYPVRLDCGDLAVTGAVILLGALIMAAVAAAISYKKTRL